MDHVWIVEASDITESEWFAMTDALHSRDAARMRKLEYELEYKHYPEYKTKFRVAKYVREERG